MFLCVKTQSKRNIDRELQQEICLNICVPKKLYKYHITFGVFIIAPGSEKD